MGDLPCIVGADNLSQVGHVVVAVALHIAHSIDPFGLVFSAMTVETELLSIVTALDPSVDVIFVHGLDGDPIATWRMNDENSWATWIKNSLPHANVWSLRYRLRAMQWMGGAVPLVTRAVNVLAVLDSELTSPRPIVFICHSYGGLLVKQLLRSANDVALEYKGLDRVAGVVFGTPNSGAIIANFVSALRPLLGSSSAVDELTKSSPELQNLSYWFRNQAAKWSLRVYFETIPTKAGIVVDESSADLGIASVIPVGIDADHFSICKPTTTDVRVKQTFALVEKVIGAAPKAKIKQTWTSRILASPSDNFWQIRAELEAALAEEPQDADARKALAYLNTQTETLKRASRAPASHDTRATTIHSVRANNSLPSVIFMVLAALFLFYFFYPKIQLYFPGPLQHLFGF